MRLALARTVWLLHIAVFGLIAIAWALPWRWAMWTAVIGYPLVQIQWLVFGNRCVLTILEEKLRGPEAKRYVAAEEAEEKPTHFVAELFSRILGRPVSHFWGDVASYGFVWGGFAVAALRLYLSPAGA